MPYCTTVRIVERECRLKLAPYPAPFGLIQAKPLPVTKREERGCHYGCVAHGEAGIKPVATTAKSWFFLNIFKLRLCDFSFIQAKLEKKS
jgi:hypothetical protein